MELDRKKKVPPSLLFLWFFYILLTTHESQASNEDLSKQESHVFNPGLSLYAEVMLMRVTSKMSSAFGGMTPPAPVFFKKEKDPPPTPRARAVCGAVKAAVSKAVKASLSHECGEHTVVAQLTQSEAKAKAMQPTAHQHQYTQNNRWCASDVSNGVRKCGLYSMQQRYHAVPYRLTLE